MVAALFLQLHSPQHRLRALWLEKLGQDRLGTLNHIKTILNPPHNPMNPSKML